MQESSPFRAMEDVNYSDGMVARGIASVLTSGNGEVDWEPTQVISYGSGA